MVSQSIKMNAFICVILICVAQLEVLIFTYLESEFGIASSQIIVITTSLCEILRFPVTVC